MARQQQWADDRHSIQEIGTVVSVAGTVARVKRAGQTTAIPIRVLGGLGLVANDKVLIERPHGDLETAFIRAKVT